MSEGYWVFRDIEVKLGVDRGRQIAKSPDNLGRLLRILRPKSRDRIILTPHVFQENTHFELVTVYANPAKRTKAVERYMFLAVCEQPAEDVLPVLTLAKDLEDCISEEERMLWLKAASPVVDSARMLGRSADGLGLSTEIAHPYLNKHRRKIINRAHRNGVDYTQYALYKDNDIVRPEPDGSALQLAVIAALSSL